MNPWNTQDLTFDEDAFSGQARLFPLPDLVLYPHVVQPLHVFEDRYREMVADALAGDHLIAMAMLEPGWEHDYDSRPPIASVGCLGKIITHHQLDDGCYNLLLLGVRRIEIAGEVEPVRSFRQANVKVLSDCYSEDTSLDPERLRFELLQEFQRHLPNDAQVSEQLEHLLSEHIPLGALTDLVSYTLPLEMGVKRRLLVECRVEERAQILLQFCQARQREEENNKTAGHGFPPPFSCN